MIIQIGTIASFVGFCIALYIYRKQIAKKPLMCPRRAPCEIVITSPQATTFGISNAKLGMVFYLAVFFFLFCLGIGGSSKILEILLFILTGGGFVFSIYLVRVQKNIIKQWCVWCLASAVMATIVFIVALLLIFTI
jgi:uncharacterized membrane protein